MFQREKIIILQVGEANKMFIFSFIQYTNMFIKKYQMIIVSHYIKKNILN